MAATELNKYIEKRYRCWLDYSRHHCSIAGIPDESVDVLNEVILALLQKDESRLMKLMNSKKDKYTELDFYVLRMIELNVYSTTAPYKNKYKPIPADRNVKLRRLNIEDTQDSEEDISTLVLDRFEQVREAFDSLNLSEKAKRVFEYKFFQDQSFSDWAEPETRKELYEIYGKVVDLIRARIGGKTLI